MPPYFSYAINWVCFWLVRTAVTRKNRVIPGLDARPLYDPCLRIPNQYAYLLPLIPLLMSDTGLVCGPILQIPLGCGVMLLDCCRLLRKNKRSRSADKHPYEIMNGSFEKLSTNYMEIQHVGPRPQRVWEAGSIIRWIAISVFKFNRYIMFKSYASIR